VVTGSDHCQGTLDCGVVCVVVVLYYLGQYIKISVQVVSSHVLHNHALYCSIKALKLPIAFGLIWEAGDMFDMEVIKQLLQLGVGELTPIVALEYLWSMVLTEWDTTSFMVSEIHQMCKSGSVLSSCPPISISTNDLFFDLVLSSIPIKSEDDEAIHSATFRPQTIPPSSIDQHTVSQLIS